MSGLTTDSVIVQDWIAQAVPPGSARYYALLGEPAERRYHTQCLLALQHIWSQAGFAAQHSGATTLKLDWWRQELQRSATHPLHSEIANLLKRQPQIKQNLLDLLAGYRSLAQNGSPADDPYNREFHFSTGALACRLIAQLQCSTSSATNHPASTFTAVDKCGIALSQWRCLRRLPLHLANGLLCLHRSTLDAAGIAVQELQPAANNARLQEFFLAATRATQDQLASACDELLQAPRKQQRSLYVYARLQTIAMDETISAGANLLQEQIRITAFRFFWNARKYSRQYDRACRVQAT